MNQPTLQRRSLKYRAKQTFFRYIRPCVLAAFLLLCFSMLSQVFLRVSGGMLFYDFLDVRQFPLDTGLFRAAPDVMTSILTAIGLDARLGAWGGLVFAVRDVSPGAVLVLPVAWRQLLDMAVINALVFLVSAPLEFGILSQFSRVLEDRPQRLRHLFGWYASPARSGKAVAVHAALGLWRFAASTVCMLPGVLCLYLGDMLPGGQFLVMFAPLLSALGALVGIYLYTLLLPARYVLARHPEYGLGRVFREGRRLTAGRKGEYFRLNLSFLPWQIASMLLYSVPSLFVIPYVELSNYLFLDPPSQPEAPPVSV